MKLYTDLEQSKKLAEILPPESADMYYYTINGDWEWYETPNVIERRDDLDEHTIPCWSLAALLQVLPNRVDSYRLILGKLESNDGWYIGYTRADCIANSNLCDACVEMILKLHEQKLL